MHTIEDVVRDTGKIVQEVGVLLQHMPDDVDQSDLNSLRETLETAASTVLEFQMYRAEQD